MSIPSLADLHKEIVGIKISLATLHAMLCQLFYLPTYEPSKWNDNNGIQFHNNCYNYACNMITNTYAQPGRATGNQYASVDCQGVTPAAKSDGLVDQDCDKSPPTCCYKVALVIWPDPQFPDFHWYRQDTSGTWSHKPGGTPATDKDNSGNTIIDPRTANRGPYTIFCQCFGVCQGKVKIN